MNIYLTTVLVSFIILSIYFILSFKKSRVLLEHRVMLLFFMPIMGPLSLFIMIAILFYNICKKLEER